MFVFAKQIRIGSNISNAEKAASSRYIVNYVVYKYSGYDYIEEFDLDNTFPTIFITCNSGV